MGGIIYSSLGAANIAGPTCRHIQLTELQMDHTYGIVMKVIAYTLVMFIIPFVTLIIVNSRIVLALRRSSSLRGLHTRRKLLIPKVCNRYDIPFKNQKLLQSLPNYCNFSNDRQVRSQKRP